MDIEFMEINSIEEYARVMYNDVKLASKDIKIEVCYDGKDIKELLEYLFRLEKKNKELIEKFKEIKKLIDEDYFEDGSFNNEYYVKEILNEVLKGDSDE